MLNLFKKFSYVDILEELNNKTFNEDKVYKLLKDIDINKKFNDGDTFLHKIIPNNNIESVRALITFNIDINTPNFDGDTPLIIASRYEYTDTIDALIRAKADITISNDEGRLAIQEAIANDNFDGYKLLAKYQDDFNHKDNEGNTLLHDAINSSSKEILEDLIQNRNILPGYSVLFCEALYKDYEILRKILNYFEDINILDDNNQNLLFYLVKEGIESYESLQYVLENGIDINCINKDGETAIIHLVKYIIELEQTDEVEFKAKIQSLIELIPVLIEEGIDLEARDNSGENVLSHPTNALSKQVIEALLEYECDPNILTSKNQTALTLSCMMGNKALDIIYLLLDYGASPNIEDNEGKTIVEKMIDIELYKKSGKKLKASERRLVNEKNDYLVILDGVLTNAETYLTKLNSKGDPYIFEPINYGNMSLVKLLIKHGADINQVNKDNLNIIYKFMAENKTFRREIDQKNYYTNLKNIIGLGANVNAKDSYGGITLHKAILDSDIQTVKIILHGGADINAIDNRGRNMVHNTIWKNKRKTFKLIHTFNKKLLNIPDKFGVLPINYAAFLGYTDLVLELIETGSHINNPNRKTHYILNFLKKFHKNINTLHENALTKNDKTKVRTLVENMKNEFNIE